MKQRDRETDRERERERDRERERETEGARRAAPRWHGVPTMARRSHPSLVDHMPAPHDERPQSDYINTGPMQAVSLTMARSRVARKAPSRGILAMRTVGSAAVQRSRLGAQTVAKLSSVILLTATFSGRATICYGGTRPGKQRVDTRRASETFL